MVKMCAVEISMISTELMAHVRHIVTHGIKFVLMVVLGARVGGCGCGCR